MEKIYARKAKSDIVVEHTESFLKLYFDEFNKLYFNSKLNRKQLKLEWIDGERSYFASSASIANKKIIPIKISIAKKNNFVDFRNTMVHEMLHYYVNCFAIKITNANWIEYVKIVKEQGFKRAHEYITGGNAHCSMWLELARSLNSKHKELDITVYSGVSTKNLSQSKKEAKDLHLIFEKVHSDKEAEEKYYFLSKENYDYLCLFIKKKKLEKPYSEIYEQKINTSRMIHSIKETPKGFKIDESAIKYYEKLGILDKEKEFLGYKKYDK